MLLLDTNVWIHHFKFGNPELIPHLENGDVKMHDFILAELSLGHFKTSKLRNQILERLNLISKIRTSSHEEVMSFIEKRKIAGRGIGYIDCHLVHSAINNNLKLITLDKRLSAVYNKLK